MKIRRVIGAALVGLGLAAPMSVQAADVNWGGVVNNALRGNVSGAINSATGNDRYNYNRGYNNNYYGRGFNDGYYGRGYNDYGRYSGRTWNSTNPRYGYNYNYPNQYYRGNQVYTQPYQHYTARPLVESYTVTPAVPNPPAVVDPVEALIVNPAANESTLSFVVDGRQMSVAPGEGKLIKMSTPGIIEFDRGVNQGTGRYQLNDGMYTFGPTENGWELFRKPMSDVRTAERELGIRIR